MARRRAASPRPPSPRPRARSPPPPAPRAAAPPPAHPSSGGGGLMTGLAGTVMQGMAFGTGSAVAHRAVDSVLGPRGYSPPPEEAQGAAQTIVQEQLPCHDQAKAFSECMVISNGDMEPCRAFFERMQECRLALQ